MELLENIKFFDLFIAIVVLIASLLIKHRVGEEWYPVLGKSSKSYNALKLFTDVMIGIIPIVGCLFMRLTEDSSKIIIFIILLMIAIFVEAKLRRWALAVWAKNEDVKMKTDNFWPIFKVKVIPYLAAFCMIVMAVLVFIVFLLISIIE